MTHPDQPSHPATDPTAGPGPGPSDPQSVHRAYLTTDIRPAIHTATTRQLRAVLTEITWHLCHHLTSTVGLIPQSGPDSGEPWQASQACRAGSGTQAGFQLYQRTIQAVAGHYLRALGFDPARAAGDNTYPDTSIDPSLRAARKPRLRQILLCLADCLDATVRDADIAFGAADDALADLPEDVWEEGIGVITAIGLYRHAARVMAVHVLYYVWDALGITAQPQPPALRSFASADFIPTNPN